MSGSIAKGDAEVAAFVLAGGASARMGRDKALLEIGGVPILLRTVRLVAAHASSATVIGPPERYRSLGLDIVPDTWTGQGPLGGIATALHMSSSEWNLILSSDLPYLTSEWIGWLLSQAKESSRSAVVPKSERGLEPLAAVYRKECAEPILAALQKGVRKVTDAIAGLQPDFIDEANWEGHDPNHRVLKNMNTPEDYREALAWWERKRQET